MDCATQPRGSFPGGIARPGTSLFLARIGAVLLGFGAPAVSLLVLAGAAIEIRAIDMHAVLAMVPRTPLFWLVFLLAYATPILADWLLYRRIWRLPLTGLAPLTRKLVGNELVLSYAGDAYLYAWARRRGVAEAAAFRAVSDVAILSAVASNATTLIVAAIAMPFFGMIGLDFPPWAVAGLVVAMLAVPMAALMLRDRLFLLPRRDLALTLAVQVGRATLTMVLIALLWHLALPDVAPVWWLIFAALKLLVSRLAFISNRDLVLAGLSVLLLGPHAELAVLMTMIAALTICTHILAGTALLVKDMVAGTIHRVQPGGIDAAGVAPA
ncbi:hypothetical protein ABC974_07050 [Sphingomonas oligophenolica]|uniref:Flippase-like domain-containing protein n=1 Tax=Sphingomonas oligophenolica TaxID=301154 RepID=A0ABU9Y0N9_9SPHN